MYIFLLNFTNANLCRNDKLLLEHFLFFFCVVHEIYLVGISNKGEDWLRDDEDCLIVIVRNSTATDLIVIFN